MPRAAAPIPAHRLKAPDTRVYVGDSREHRATVPECKAREIDLIKAAPPFNWQRDYDRHQDRPHDDTIWNDSIPDDEYLKFTYDWLDGCIRALKPTGTLWVNIPDDWAAEICVHLKQRRLHMVNWCIWHYRFGQNRLERFINTKVHVFYFCKDPARRTWNVKPILEPTDRATIYADKRTYNKKEGDSGLRVPMDVWYGKNWGRIQGNNKERRPGHDNQIPEVYLERVIRATSNEGDLVLDPFLGSGTTCTVARELRRRSIGFEYSKANAASAFKRIGNGPYRIRYDAPTVHVNPIFGKRNLAQPAGSAFSDAPGTILE
ncbi:MAG: site-specific DNA-methyltransferase [Phycisphaerae bacterium]|nr:site-specific DNA-methyltransferase [Phycisphaerae bacterium]